MDPSEAERSDAIAEIAEVLPQRTGQLGRLLWRHARGPLHRGMASVLSTLDDGPQTIGTLAHREGVAQPTLTRMVERLEKDGLVRRRRSELDGRVVLVDLSPQGTAELASLRARYLAALQERLSDLSDADLQALRTASDALVVLIEALQAE